MIGFMLILTRRMGQSIVIGETIRITVLKTRGNHVQLGIQAPADVIIKRGESPPHPLPELQNISR